MQGGYEQEKKETGKRLDTSKHLQCMLECPDDTWGGNMAEPISSAQQDYRLGWRT